MFILLLLATAARSRLIAISGHRQVLRFRRVPVQVLLGGRVVKVLTVGVIVQRCSGVVIVPGRFVVLE